MSNIAYCEECGLVLVKSPSGYATCPEMHGRLTKREVWSSVWAKRLVRHRVDMRTIPVAEKKKRARSKYLINGKLHTRLKSYIEQPGLVFALTPFNKKKPVGVFIRAE